LEGSLLPPNTAGIGCDDCFVDEAAATTTGIWPLSLQLVLQLRSFNAGSCGNAGVGRLGASVSEIPIVPSVDTLPLDIT